MRVSKAFRIFLIAAVSAASVAGIRALDAKRQRSNETSLALRWTRQMVTQTESLALSADARGNRDPLTWAARLLSQGTDSRIIFATKAQVPTPVAQPETYSLDPGTGIFDYTKIFDMQEGTGIHIRLYTARTGIFGAKTPLQHDLTVTALFFLIYGFLFFLLARTERGYYKKHLHHEHADDLEGPSFGALGGAPDGTPGRTPAPPSPLRPEIAQWVGDAKGALTDLGNHLRELVRGSHELCVASREAKEHIGSLRERVHHQIEQLHLNTRSNSEIADLAVAVEITLAQKKLDAETTKLLKRLLALGIRYAENVGSAELILEPIAIDADLAFNSLENAGRATEGVASEIRHTTTGMLDQVRRMGELRKKGA